MKLGYHKQNIPLVLALAGVLVACLFGYLGFGKGPRPAKSGDLRSALLDASADQKLQKFSLTGFDEKGRKFWKLEGDVAKIDRAQNINLQDNVTLRLKENTVIRTERVQWSQAGGTLKTDAAVFVNHQSAKIKGRGAWGEPNKHFVQLNKDIVMTVSPDTTITCRGPMKIFYTENKTQFYRNVKVVDPRGVLTAKRMDVFFDGEKKTVTEIVAIGDVVIEREADTTHSDRAVYLPATGSIRLEGRPHITLHKASSSFFDAPVRN